MRHLSSEWRPEPPDQRRITDRSVTPVFGGPLTQNRRFCLEYTSTLGRPEPPDHRQISARSTRAADGETAEGVEPAEEVEEPPPRGAAALFDDWGL